MAVLNFIWYCIDCMIGCITSMFGNVPDNFTMKEIIIGLSTMIVIVIIIFLVLWLIGVIKIKKKD